LDYTDHLSLGIETKVLINFPKPKFAILPVSLALALVRLSATVNLGYEAGWQLWVAAE
jgi:maintenance of morphology protein 1